MAALAKAQYPSLVTDVGAASILGDQYSHLILADELPATTVGIPHQIGLAGRMGPLNYANSLPCCIAIIYFL